MPSKGEGFGIVFLEALSCGKPVIAGNKDGSVDAVLNGKLGVLVDPDDVAEIGEAIIRVLSGHTDVTGQTSEVSLRPRGAYAPEGGQGAEVGDQTSDVRGQTAPSGPEGPTPRREGRLLEPERLRREVIAAYGFERFRMRLGEIVTPLLVNR